MKAVLLAAYGSRSSDRVSMLVNRCARRLGSLALFDEVEPAFYKEPPFFGQVLAGLKSDEVIIVPMLAGAGYTYHTLMPREIGLCEMGLSGRITRRDNRTILVTEVLGAHQRITEIIRRLSEAAVERHGLTSSATAVVLVGHGTRLDSRGAATTFWHAKRLLGQGPWADVLAVFLNQAPELERVFEMTSCENLVVVPNLLGVSSHVMRDIPERLSVPVRNGRYPPAPSRISGRTIVLTRTPYEDPSITEIVLDLVAKTQEPKNHE